jgi:predicted nucleotidyltransferase
VCAYAIPAFSTRRLRGTLTDELETLLGVHVDLLTPADLPEKFRGQVLAQARPV